MNKIVKALAKIGTDEEITEDDLTSAWIALNTRTVYLSHKSNDSNVTNVSNHRDDTSNWALVPFLDCLNHHSKAKIETIHSDTHFQITSSTGNSHYRYTISTCKLQASDLIRPSALHIFRNFDSRKCLTGIFWKVAPGEVDHVIRLTRNNQTYSEIESGQQVYISYGQHSDTFLLIEYGFVIGQENDHNFVEIETG